MAFIVRILYPVAATVSEPVAGVEVSSYRFNGAKALHPLEMSDDGHTTTILWAGKTPIPAVYIIDGEGREALVNGAVRNGRFVVDQVANEFIFRLGSEEEHAVRRVTRVHKK
jgi:type IV secretion system protein VirB9